MRCAAVVVLLGAMLAFPAHAGAGGLYATPEDEAIEKRILQFSGENVPLILEVNRDAVIKLNDAPCTVEELRERLAAIARADHDVPVLIVADAAVPLRTERAMEEICRNSGVHRTLHLRRLPRRGPDGAIIKS